MKVKYGIFEEVEQPAFIKEQLSALFEPLKTEKFNSVFIAYPHQCYSDDYVPETSDEKTLEIYFYSLPSEIRGNPNSGAYLHFEGREYPLPAGQRDYLNPAAAVPKGYNYVEDDEGIQIAVYRENKIWVLYDICHQWGVTDSALTIGKKFLNSLIEAYISPPTEEEINRKIIQQIQKLIKANFNTTKKSLEDHCRGLEVEIKASEDRIVELTRTLSQNTDELELMKNQKFMNPEDVFAKIKKMAFVERVLFSRGSVMVETKPIKIGPFEYGSWRINLAQGIPVMRHELYPNIRHAYEYADHRMCLGGFADSYANAMSKGQVDRALAICRIEITNYSTESRMTNIETFLSGYMGRKFDKIMDEIQKEKFKEADNIRISHINGNEVTFVGVKLSSEGREVPTAERVVITYD